MSWVALGVAVVGAGATVGGAYISRPEGVDFPSLGDLPVSGGINPYGDPVFAQLALDYLNQIGAPTRGIEITSSPSQLAYQSMIQSPGVTNEHASSARRRLGKFQELIASAPDASPSTIEQLTLQVESEIEDAGWRKFITAGGYRTTRDLIAAELKWRDEAGAAKAAQDAARPQLAQAHRDTMAKIAQLQANFPVFGQGDIDKLATIERDKAREAVLAQANVGGYNPAAGLAEIEKDNAPMARAIALLGGQQQLSSTALNTLINSIAIPNDQARTLAQMGLGISQGNFSQAAQQASTLAGIANSQAGFNVARAGTLGTGIAAAGTGLSNAFQTYNFLKQLNATQAPATTPNAATSPGYLSSTRTPSAFSAGTNLDILSILGGSP